MRPTTRALGTITAIVSLAAGCLAWQTPPASAEPGCHAPSSDFDRDGTPDVAVGIPGGSGRNGAVQVRLSNEGRPITKTITGSPGFGSAITSLSSYQNEGDDALCSQLVIGSPDESLSTDKARSGVVHVYTWSRSAKRFTLRGQFYPQAQGVEGGTSQVPGSVRPWPPSSVPRARPSRGRLASTWAHQASTSAGSPTPAG